MVGMLYNSNNALTVPNTLSLNLIRMSGSMIRVNTKDGKDVTNFKYMQLKRLLAKKGVSNDKLNTAAGPRGLKLLGIKEGVLERLGPEPEPEPTPTTVNITKPAGLARTGSALAALEQDTPVVDTKYTLKQNPKFSGYIRSGKSAKATASLVSTMACLQMVLYLGE